MRPFILLAGANHMHFEKMMVNDMSICLVGPAKDETGATGIEYAPLAADQRGVQFGQIHDANCLTPVTARLEHSRVRQTRSRIARMAGEGRGINIGYVALALALLAVGIIAAMNFTQPAAVHGIPDRQATRSAP